MVPSRYSANQKLGRWVGAQRTQKMRQANGQLTTMTPDREEKLNSIGFVYNVLEHNRSINEGIEDGIVLYTSWGDEMPFPKDAGAMRIVYQNINGLTNNPNDHVETLKSLQDLEPDIWGLAESNLDWKQDTNVKLPFWQRVNDLWNRMASMIASCSQEQGSMLGYLPGGVIQATVGHLYANIESSSEDPSGMGRWVSQSILVGRSELRLSIITSYRSVIGSRGSKSDSQRVQMQQMRHMEKRGVHNFDARAQIIQDLIVFINQLQKEGNEVILMLDANEELEGPAMQKLCEACNLFDLHERWDDEGPPPATFRYGSTKIDHILGTKLVKDGIVGRGILGEDLSPRSDHLALWVDLVF